MKDNCILTAESVTEGHPDKLCDTIADAVVDACLTQDAAARVACEVMATAGKIIAAGEITAAKIPDIPATICRTVREAGYGGSDYEVEVITHEQSPDIAEAVCGGTETGAGDQGILYGFACDETKELLPLPVVLAHRLTRLLTDTRRQGVIPGLRPDGKAQVSVEYRSGVPYRVAAVVVSCQHEDELPLPELRRDILCHVIRPAMQELPLDEHTEVLVNPSGRFVQGGFEADTGLTGRKLMVDTYGGLAPHGGGALSGKDGTKVDRSGAYMARYIAKNIVAAGLAKRCTISLAYAYHPTAADYAALRDAVGQYLSAFRERTPELERSGPKLVYICAPLRGDVTNNVEFARQKAQEVFVEGNIPICPHLLFPPVADPDDPAQDEKARAMGLRLLESCQQMNVYGPVWTDGMWQEIYKAGELGIPVLTDQKTIGRTPPARHPKRKER